MTARNSRRQFLFLSSGVVAGNLLVPITACAQAPAAAPKNAAPNGASNAASGLVTGVPKPLRFTEIPGFLSAEQIAPHHQAHYGGALRGYVSADEKIEASITSGEAIEGAAYQTLKRAVSSKANSVLLHELYFDGMTPTKADPGSALRAAIEKRFGSIDKWRADFQASAKTAKGWAVLMRHPVNGKLFNAVCDEHADGCMWMAAPLVVVDTYEHAFYVDYKNKKADYIERFADHIDWAQSERRFVAT